MGPLDSSAGVPEQSGVRRAFLAHHSMKFTAHSFPAPRRFLLEAEQLLTEWFLSHTDIYIYENQPRSGLTVTSP